MEFKGTKGDIIYAINPCLMESDGRPNLTIGNAYTIIDSDEEEFYVIDDEGDAHWFYWEEFDTYFQFKDSAIKKAL